MAQCVWYPKQDSQVSLPVQKTTLFPCLLCHACLQWNSWLPPPPPRPKYIIYWIIQSSKCIFWYLKRASRSKSASIIYWHFLLECQYSIKKILSFLWDELKSISLWFSNEVYFSCMPTLNIWNIFCENKMGNAVPCILIFMFYSALEVKGTCGSFCMFPIKSPTYQTWVQGNKND